MHASLPLELLIKIVGYLSRDALKQWCSANSVFLSIGRPELFSIVLYPTIRNFDSSLLLTGRGKELVVRYTRGIVILPRWKKFFTDRSGEGAKRTQLLLSLIEEVGKNLRFLGITDYDDMRWTNISRALRDSLFQHVVPHVQVLAIYGISHIPFSTLVKSAHGLNHLQLEEYSFSVEKVAKIGSGILPNLQNLTVTFPFEDSEECRASSLSTLLDANCRTIRALRLSRLDDEQGIYDWSILHPTIERLIYILTSEYDITHPVLPPPTLPKLHTLQYYFQGFLYDKYWPIVMKRIRQQALVQPALRLVEIHVDGAECGRIESALDKMEETEVIGQIEMNLFFNNHEGKADAQLHREISALVKEKFATWIAAGRMQIFAQLNHVRRYIDLEI
ncbi:hypothetical protein DL96DRAFT_1608236 [Flagelloscypha sp. PMI_526]|nr:hypothetical protein DL96DRAFT_1608236 [Flagelloscypha sp. PMI_526]